MATRVSTGQWLLDGEEVALAGRLCPRASGYRGQPEPPTKTTGGARTKSIQKEKENRRQQQALLPLCSK